LQQTASIPPSHIKVRLKPLARMAALGSWQVDLAHSRPFPLLIWITKGQGLALLDGRRRGVGVNNVLHVPRGALFSVALGRPGFAQVLTWHGEDRTDTAQTPVHLRLRDAVAQNELAILFDAITREQNEDRPFSAQACAAYGELIKIWLARHGDGPAQAEPPDSAARRLSRAYCQRLADLPSGPQRVGEHAAALSFTATHLNRVCKEQTGRSAAALLAETTLHAARSALTETDRPVQDIARLLGFASPAYFTRFIRRHTGYSPSDLRNSPALTTASSAPTPG
jgi:AraC family transcriptional activator of pobA